MKRSFRRSFFTRSEKSARPHTAGSRLKSVLLLLLLLGGAALGAQAQGRGHGHHGRDHYRGHDRYDKHYWKHRDRHRYYDDDCRYDRRVYYRPYPRYGYPRTVVYAPVPPPPPPVIYPRGPRVIIDAGPIIIGR